MAGRKLEAVVQKWNEHFFLPRGLHTQREFPKHILIVQDAQFFQTGLRGDKSTARHLLEDGVNPNTRNEEGATTLYGADQKRDFAIVKMLIRYGADVETAIESYTPLYVAVSSNEYPIIEALLERPLNIDPRTPTGETPLYKAVLMGHFKIAQLLIAQSADVSARSGGGDSMLYLASSKKHFSTSGAIIGERMPSGRENGISSSCARRLRIVRAAQVTAIERIGRHQRARCQWVESTGTGGFGRDSDHREGVTGERCCDREGYGGRGKRTKGLGHVEIIQESQEI